MILKNFVKVLRADVEPRLWLRVFCCLSKHFGTEAFDLWQNVPYFFKKNIILEFGPIWIWFNISSGCSSELPGSLFSLVLLFNFEVWSKISNFLSKVNTFNERMKWMSRFKKDGIIFNLSFVGKIFYFLLSLLVPSVKVSRFFKLTVRVDS